MSRYLAGADVGGTFTDLARLRRRTRARLTLDKLPDHARRSAAAPSSRACARCRRRLSARRPRHHARHQRADRAPGRAAVGLLTTEAFATCSRSARSCATTPSTFSSTARRRWSRAATAVPVRERIGADGAIVLPARRRRRARPPPPALRADGVRSLAIAFFNSYRNPAHERARQDRSSRAALPAWRSAPRPRSRPRSANTSASPPPSPTPTSPRSRPATCVELAAPRARRRAALRHARRRRHHDRPRRQRAADRAGRIRPGRRRDGRRLPRAARPAGDDVIAFDMGGTTAKALPDPRRPARIAARIRGRRALERFKQGQRPAAPPARRSS